MPIAAAIPVRVLVTLVVALAFSFAARAQEPPLHERIDQLVEAAAVGPMSAVAGDADFVRRVWLDLAGMVPPPSATRTVSVSCPGKQSRPVPAPRRARHDTARFQIRFFLHGDTSLRVSTPLQRHSAAARSHRSNHGRQAE